MKKNICIIPIDDEMELLSRAIFLLNEVKKKGFHKRDAFVNAVVDLLPSYSTPFGINMLNNFWAGRVKSEQLNYDIETVLEKLKAE